MVNLSLSLKAKLIVNCLTANKVLPSLYENSSARLPNPRSAVAETLPIEWSILTEAIPSSKEFFELVKLVKLFVLPDGSAKLYR